MSSPQQRAFFADKPQVRALALTLAFVALRLLASPLIGLGVDESYTVAISRQLSLSYFDHPPLHQWVVWAAEQVLGSGRSGRWVRAPFIALSGVTSWLMFLLTRRLFGAPAGVWATLAFNLTPFFTAVAGAWILPDGPLNLCLLAAALALTAILFPEATQTSAGRWSAWLTFGLFIGLAGLSKYQAVFFCLGLAIFMVTASGRRRELLQPAPVVAGVLALAIVSPVLIWNAEHGWVSFVFQGGRGAVHHGPRPLGIIVALLGQAALLLPWIWLPLAMAGYGAVRAGPADQRRWLCLMLAAPAIIVFSLTPLWGERALPHWSMPGWLMLFPLLGDRLERVGSSKSWPRVWAIASTAATLAIWLLVAIEADTGWASRAFPGLRRDPSLETVSWSHLRPTVLAARRADANCLFVAALNWRDGGKIGAAVGDIAPVRVLSHDPRGFGFLTQPPSLRGCDALIVAVPDALTHQRAQLAPLFAALGPVAEDHEGRGERDEVALAVLPAHGLLKSLPTPYRRAP